MAKDILTLSVEVHDDGNVLLGALVSRGRQLHFCRTAIPHQPWTSSSLSQATRALTRSFLTPELAEDADQAFEATFEALTDPF